MVCVIGLPIEFGLAPSHLILFPLAVVIFLVFYFLVFSRLVRKHTSRIRARAEDRLPFWHFLNASSWAGLYFTPIGTASRIWAVKPPPWISNVWISRSRPDWRGAKSGYS